MPALSAMSFLRLYFIYKPLIFSPNQSDSQRISLMLDKVLIKTH